jgi:hypothetical protein
MSDKRLKDAIIRILNEKGYRASAVDESDIKTPDIFAIGTNEEFLFELKERQFPAKLNPDNPINEYGLSRQNRLSGIIKDSARQLEFEKSKKLDAVFRLLWIVCDSEWRYEVYEQFRASAYGLRRVAGNKNNKGFSLEGYYVSNSDFYQQSSFLDGIVFGRLEVLLLNDYSPRYQKLKDSYFRTLFGDTVLDPCELESTQKALCLRGEVNRSNEIEVIRQLEAQYSIEIGSLTNEICFTSNMTL